MSDIDILKHRVALARGDRRSTKSAQRELQEARTAELRAEFEVYQNSPGNAVCMEIVNLASSARTLSEWVNNPNLRPLIAIDAADIRNAYARLEMILATLSVRQLEAAE